jgi:hypothetical protein
LLGLWADCFVFFLAAHEIGRAIEQWLSAWAGCSRFAPSRYGGRGMGARGWGGVAVDRGGIHDKKDGLALRNLREGDRIGWPRGTTARPAVDIISEFCEVKKGV